MKHRYDAEANAQSISDETRRLFGAIRRLAVRVTKGAIWQVLGHRINNVEEFVDGELFSGIGFFSRPRKKSRAEAIVVSIGDSRHSVIIATRDEDLRRLWKSELEAGEDVAAMFSSATIILIKPDGTVEIRSRGGEAQELATKADVAKIETAIAGATITALDGGASLKATILGGLASSLHGASGLEPWPVGTKVLKAE